MPLIRPKDEEALIFARLRKTRVMTLEHKKDKHGKVVMDRGKPLMNEVPKLENGKPIILDDLTVDDWLATIPEDKQQFAWDTKLAAARVEQSKKG